MNVEMGEIHLMYDLRCKMYNLVSSGWEFEYLTGRAYEIREKRGEDSVKFSTVLKRNFAEFIRIFADNFF